MVFHVLNRSVRRQQLFFDRHDYETFERVLSEALTREPVRLLGYCVLHNHWHLVLKPEGDGLPRFMHWLTLTHARRWHHARGSRGTGHVYQNRYQAIPVQSDRHLLTLLRYVERNALRAGLVQRAEDWRWSSLWRRYHGCQDLPLAEWPIPQPHDWIDFVNTPQTESEIQAIRTATNKGRPLGDDDWSGMSAERLGIPAPRRRGRPPTARKGDRV